jgi:hypothetical protein
MPNYGFKISLTNNYIIFMENICENNILGKGQSFFIHFCRGKRHERSDSAPFIKCKPSKISYEFRGVSMNKYTGRENL